jgi:hypothetical protein
MPAIRPKVHKNRAGALTFGRLPAQPKIVVHANISLIRAKSASDTHSMFSSIG